MKQARFEAARKDVVALGECLRAWRRSGDGIDSEVADLVLAETLLMWRQSVTKK